MDGVKKRRRVRTAAPLAALFLLFFVTPVEAQYFERSVASFSTTSATFVDVTGGSLTFTPSAATDIWILLFSARLMSSGTNMLEQAEVRYLVNAVEHGYGGTQNRTLPNQAGSWQHFYRITGTTATQTVQVQIREVNGLTATIEDLQIIAFKLPAGADFQYTETETAQTIPSGWASYDSLTVTPSSPGDYLIMAVVNGTEGPGSAVLCLRLQDPGGAYWPIDSWGGGQRYAYFANPRRVWQSFFLARAQFLNVASTYTLWADGAYDPDSTIQYARIMAFRTDAFDSYESVENTGMSSTTSTSPVVSSTLTTAAPPGMRDYIVIQSQVVMMQGTDGIDERRSGFEADDGVKTSFDHVVDTRYYLAGSGFFDALTTPKPIRYENTFSTSNSASEVQVKESVIHVLRLPTASCPCSSLSTTEGAGTFTVTAPSAFEMVFNAAGGGSIYEFYDLVEDPTRTYDLAGSLNPMGLHNSGMKVGPRNYNSSNDDTGPKLQILEATPTRVRIREEAFYEDESTGNLLAGIKGIGDYSIHPSGKTAIRWNRKATLPVTYDTEYAELIVHFTNGTPPLDSWTIYSETDDTPANPGTDDFLLAQNDIIGGRTDFLDIIYKEWTIANGHLETADITEWGTSNSDERLNAYWDDLTGATVSAGASEVWNFLIHTKPANLLDNIHTEVTGRRDDYQGPDSLSFGAGSGWNENTADGDFYNESEAAYTIDFDPTNGLTFDMDGSTTTRYQPFFKIRQWRSFQEPTLTLEGLALTNDVQYRADIKPFSDADFADRIFFHTTLQSFASVTSPDIGIGTGASEASMTYVAARYGSGAAFDSTADQIDIPLIVGSVQNIELDQGRIELWYKPNYDHDDDVEHYIFDLDNTGNCRIRIKKEGAAFTNNLTVQVLDASSGQHNAVIPAANYRWEQGEWIHVAMTWDSGDATDNVNVYLNGVELVPIAVSDGPFTMEAENAAGALRIGNRIFADTATNADGIIDEFTIYNQIDPNQLAYAGLTSSADESLASDTNNASLPFAAVDANRRGEYLFLGSDSKFRGFNISLSTTGVGTVDLQWEYWNGTAWANLEAVAGFTDQTNSLTRTYGTVYWTADPTGWSEYSINGGPDLYYVRASLASGNYTTTPVEEFIKTDILLFQYCGDIDLSAQTFDFAMPVPTAVELAWFEAVGLDGAVDISWRTASELNNLGFHLYRAGSADGPYERITSSPIPGLGSTPIGAQYRYRDKPLTNGVTYYYKLEDIETTGKTKLHGPVSATPKPGVDDVSDNEPSRSSDEEDRGPALITYGDPTLNSFRISSHGAHQVVLELETAGFYAEPLEDGTVRLMIPDFHEVGDVGSPSIPVKRSWVEAIAGRKVKLVTVKAEAVESVEGLYPASAAQPELVATRRGTIRASRRGARTGTFRAAGLYPSEAARLVEVAFQGEVKKALVELAPLQWDASKGRLMLARRLVVRLAFVGREPFEKVVNGARGRREQRKAGSMKRGVIARLAVKAAGLYGVHYEDVFDRRRARSVSTSELRLSRHGKAVAFHIEPDGETFGPGSRLYFVSEGHRLNSYGHEAVYELEVGEPGEVMVVDSASPRGKATRFYWKRLELEENLLYQAGLVDAPDTWLWELLFAPAVKTYRFDVTRLAPVSEPARLEVRLQGTSDLPISPDHHVRVYVNGAFVAETIWDGKTAQRIDAELAPGVLREGENTLDIESLLDTDSSYSVVMLDRFTIAYPSGLEAENGRLEGRFSDSGVAEVAALGMSPHVLDITEDSPKWLTDSELAADGYLRFRTEAERRYLLLGEQAVLSPDVRQVKSSRLKSEQNQANYLAIGPQNLLDAAEPLLSHRRGQGLVVKAVAVEEIYSEFGFGESRPEAIRDFVAYVYHHWREPSLRYVTLLGDGTFDYKDYLDTGVTNQVPPLMVRTSYLWTASDPAYASVNGDDLLPDIAVGRLPAATPEELRVIVDKIIAYETGSANMAGPVVLVTDNPDGGGNFEADAEEIASGLLSARLPQKIFLRRLGASATRREVRNAFGEGVSLMSYLGHGGIQLWADENILNSSDVPSLDSQSQQPLVLTMNCLNGYFHFPYFDSLAEELVKADGRGAIASFSPSGLSLNAQAHHYHKAMLEEIFSGHHERLGDALTAAQAAYLEVGVFPELLTIYHLFGDPALILR